MKLNNGDWFRVTSSKALGKYYWYCNRPTDVVFNCVGIETHNGLDIRYKYSTEELNNCDRWGYLAISFVDGILSSETSHTYIPSSASVELLEEDEIAMLMLMNLGNLMTKKERLKSHE